MSLDRSPRLAPISPPYDPEVAAALAKWMPPGSALEPLKLFRTLYLNPQLSSRMRPLGAGILGPQSSLVSPMLLSWSENHGLLVSLSQKNKAKRANSFTRVIWL